MILHLKIKVIYHINRLRKKNHVIISINSKRKASDNIQYIHVKHSLEKKRKELPQLDKHHPPKLVTNIVLNNERKCFSSKIRNKARCLLIPPLFNIVLEVLASTIMQQKTIKE